MFANIGVHKIQTHMREAGIYFHSKNKFLFPFSLLIYAWEKVKERIKRIEGKKWEDENKKKREASHGKKAGRCLKRWGCKNTIEVTYETMCFIPISRKIVKNHSRILTNMNDDGNGGADSSPLIVMPYIS